jgi:hypothetical protein
MNKYIKVYKSDFSVSYMARKVVFRCKEISYDFGVMGGRYNRARGILKDFNLQNEKYLRNLVANVTHNGSYADSLEWSDLRAEARRIKAVAQKIVSDVEEANRRREQGVENKVKDGKPKTTQKQRTLFS